MRLSKRGRLAITLFCGISGASIFVPEARAQQSIPAPPRAARSSGDPAITTNESIAVEHDQVRTSREHFYNSPAERAKDDLLITAVKSSLADQGISDQHAVEVDCDHGTIFLSGVVASAEAARQAAAIASSTEGVVAVENRLTWR